MEKLNVDLIISINLYKNKNVLINQLNTIKKHVLGSYYVILNCNDEMFNILKNESFENVYINPEIINKSRNHGSLTQGIVSNMNYAIDNFIFKYFVILSGRTIFYNDMTIKNLENCRNKINYNNATPVKNTKLFQYYKNLGKKLYFSPHEGLCFSFNVCINILNFLKSNVDIKMDLYNFHAPVEEYALQSISCNEIDNTNLESGFINIGNGITESYSQFKYTRKIFYENGIILRNPALLRLKNKC